MKPIENLWNSYQQVEQSENENIIDQARRKIGSLEASCLQIQEDIKNLKCEIKQEEKKNWLKKDKDLLGTCFF